MRPPHTLSSELFGSRIYIARCPALLCFSFWALEPSEGLASAGSQRETAHPNKENQCKIERVRNVYRQYLDNRCDITAIRALFVTSISCSGIPSEAGCRSNGLWVQRQRSSQGISSLFMHTRTLQMNGDRFQNRYQYRHCLATARGSMIYSLYFMRTKVVNSVLKSHLCK